MRKNFKRFISFFLVPLTRWYLQKERSCTFLDTTVKVRPGVFHPGFFYSTQFLIESLPHDSPRHESLLELGCGTGMISIIAAKRGFEVTASDLSMNALENAASNATINHVSIRFIHSDLFDSIPKRSFDWIMINPPYYARAPKNEEALAWHCGEHFEYFQKLFKSLAAYLINSSRVIMVLTQGSEREKIITIGRENGFHFEWLKEKNVLFDGKDFLYRIKLRNQDEGTR